MSVEFHWNKLDRPLELFFLDLLNTSLAHQQLPSFLSSIHVVDFCFGSIPPHITLLDCTDPYPEFYMDDSLSTATPDHSSDDMVRVKQVEKHATDMQFKIHVEYFGDATITLTTQLLLNYPSEAFMALPVKLSIKRIEFVGTLVVAYLSDRINFCFLNPSDHGAESLLVDLVIESEVGDANKQVLKNVGKIERFVIEQVRKLVDTLLVFPCYQSIELGDEE
jgi:distribution and morphology protein 12